MTQPLAMVSYEQLLPGTQLVNRLQDLGYRVEVVNSPSSLAQEVETVLPMVLLIHLEPDPQAACEAVKQIRANSRTQHVPVIAFAPDEKSGMNDLALASGVTLFASETACLHHLPQLLEQALRVE